MMKSPLAVRLEHAIVEIIMVRNGTHQESWGVWMNSVSTLVPDLVDPADLKAALRRLLRGGIVRLSKPDERRYHGFDYSDNEGDDAFFSIGGFNVTITDDGRKYWDGIKVEPHSGTIGF
jgi:hypothetical protein